MVQVVGRVSNLVGKVTAVNHDGQKRDLNPGGQVFKGDFVFAEGDNSSVDIIFYNDNSISLDSKEKALIDESVYKMESFDDLKVIVDMDNAEDISSEVTEGEEEVISQVDEASIAERIDFGAQLASRDTQSQPFFDSQSSRETKEDISRDSDFTSFEEAAARAQLEDNIEPDNEDDDTNDIDTDVENESEEDIIDQTPDNDFGIPVNNVKESLDLELLDKLQGNETQNSINGLNLGDVMQVSNEESSLDIIKDDTKVETDTQELEKSAVDTTDKYSMYSDGSPGDEFEIPIDEIAKLGLEN